MYRQTGLRLFPVWKRFCPPGRFEGLRTGNASSFLTNCLGSQRQNPISLWLSESFGIAAELLAVIFCLLSAARPRPGSSATFWKTPGASIAGLPARFFSLPLPYWRPSGSLRTEAMVGRDARLLNVKWFLAGCRIIWNYWMETKAFPGISTTFVCSLTQFYVRKPKRSSNPLSESLPFTIRFLHSWPNTNMGCGKPNAASNCICRREVFQGKPMLFANAATSLSISDCMKKTIPFTYSLPIRFFFSLPFSVRRKQAGYGKLLRFQGRGRALP